MEILIKPLFETPHSKQLQIIKNKSKYKVIVAGRRFGKTLVSMMKLFDMMMRGKRCMYLTPEYDLADVFFNEFCEKFDESLLAGQPNKSKLTIKLKNGGSCKFFSGNAPEKIRGREYDFAIIDEAGDIVNLSYVWNGIIRPLLMGGCWFIGTPKGANFFTQLYNDAKAGKLQNTSAFHFTTYDNPHYPIEKIEESKADMPDILFRQEFMAEFTANASNPFKYEDIIKNIIPSLSTDKSVVFGVDVSNGINDYTVAIGLNSQAVMSHYTAWKIKDDYTLQADKLNELPKGTLKVIDATGAGVSISEPLENKGHYILPFSFTGKSKPVLIYKFIQAVEKGLVKYTQEVADEMFVYEMKYSESGNTKFGNQVGFNDDRVTALALAWHGYSEYVNVGSNWKGFSST